MVMMNSRYQLVGDDPAPFVPRAAAPIRIQTGSNSSFTIPASAQPAPAPAPIQMPQSFMPSFDVLAGYAPPTQPATAPIDFGMSANNMVNLPPMSIPAPAPQPVAPPPSPLQQFVPQPVLAPAGEPAVARATQPTQGMGALGSALQSAGVPAAIQNVPQQMPQQSPTQNLPQPPAQRPVSFELQRLLNHYGVTNASKPGYGGAAKPESGASDYQALLDKYNTDNDAYTDWANQYDQRMQTPMYGPGYQGPKLQPLQYPNGYQAPAATTPAVTTPTGATNPLGTAAVSGGSGDGTIGFGTSGGFTGDPNSYTGGLLNSLIGQDPWGVPVTDLSTYSSGAMAESAAAAQAAADAGLANQAAAGMTGFGGVGTDASVAGFGDNGAQAAADAGISAGQAADAGDTGTSGSDADGGEANGGADGLGGDNYRAGGLIGLHRKYGGGGEVKDFGGYGTDPSVDLPMSVSGGQTLSPALRQAIMQDALANGIDNPTANFEGAPKGGSYGYEATPQETLPQMAAAYASPEMQLYTQEYQAARRQAAEDRANFEKLLQAQLARKDETGPSKEEMYFQLAAAFGAPTKTGSFGESLAGANTVLAGHQKNLREASASARDRRDKLALEVAKYRADGSKDDLTNLRTLTVEEMKARRQGNLPLSEAGKMVYDTGLRPGQPGYAEKVNEQVAQVQANKNAALAVQQGNANLAAQRLSDAQAAAKLLTPAELKLKTEAEDTLAAAQSAMNDLDKAFVLNQNAYDNSAGDWVAKTLLGAAGSEDPKLVNTREMNNLLTGQGLTRLRATFGGNPTEGERAILLELQGIGSKSQPEREAIMKNAYRALKTAKARQEKRLADINSRAYREVTPPTIVEAQ